jgi:hypothetical protein
MVQQGQTIELTRRGADGRPLWAYRYRTGGRDSKRVQRGGFASEQDARDALERELERVRREHRIARRLTLAELVDTYLAQHDVQPVTIEKLRYLLSKATAVFGDRKIGELTSQEIAQWRMNLSPGYRFEATQDFGRSSTVRSPGGCSTSTRRRSASTTRSAAEGAASVRVPGGAGDGRRCDRTPVRADDPLCRGDGTTASGMDRPRETRHRPQRTSRLRPALVHERRAQDPEDGGEHESGTATGAGTRRARPDQQQRVAAPLSRRARRLPRHPPLPPIPVAASPEIRGHQPDSPGLRSPAHFRDLRAPCRNLDLRPFPLHAPA